MIHLIAVFMLFSLLTILPETISLCAYLQTDLIQMFCRIGQWGSITALIWISWWLAKVNNHETDERVIKFIREMGPLMGMVGTLSSLILIMMAGNHPNEGAALVTTLAGTIISGWGLTKKLYVDGVLLKNYQWMGSYQKIIWGLSKVRSGRQS